MIKSEALLQSLIQGFNNIPFNKVLRAQVDAITENQISLSFRMKDDLIGNFFKGILHGGVIASILDMAGGMASLVSLINKHPEKSLDEITEIASNFSTVDLHINYLNPGIGDWFYAKSSLIKSGKTLSFARMELYNQNENLIATANGIYLLK